MATVGALHLVLDLEGVHSLKAKRAIVRPVLDRVTGKLNVSGAEVAHQDAFSRADLCFAAVSESKDHVSRVLESAYEHAAKASSARVRSRHVEYVALGGPSDAITSMSSADSGGLLSDWSRFEES